jgi:hypothetical protein
MRCWRATKMAAPITEPRVTAVNSASRTFRPVSTAPFVAQICAFLCGQPDIPDNPDNLDNWGICNLRVFSTMLTRALIQNLVRRDAGLPPCRLERHEAARMGHPVVAQGSEWMVGITEITSW